MMDDLFVDDALFLGLFRQSVAIIADRFSLGDVLNNQRDRPIFLWLPIDRDPFPILLCGTDDLDRGVTVQIVDEVSNAW